MILYNVLKHTALDERIAVFCKDHKHDVLLYSGTRDDCPVYYEEKTIRSISVTGDYELRFVIACPPIKIPTNFSDSLSEEELDPEELPFY